MALSKEKANEYLKRLVMARLRIMMNHGFYGLLLMYMILTIDESCETAATDGNRIYFGPKFMDDLDDSELDFVMMHEILHVALRHCFRGKDYDNELFNIACDIVVNSNILKSNDMDLKTITLRKYGESMHLTPDKKEGYNYTAEEVYEMIKKQNKGKKKNKGNDDGNNNKGNGNSNNNSNGNDKSKNNKGLSDDHTRWTEEIEDTSLGDVWIKRVIDAAAAIERQNATYGCGSVPEVFERMIKDLKDPQIDWRAILSDFVQEEVCDYTFSPPDRRYDDSSFYLPDYNDTEIEVSDILFMIDTSGSMTDKMITHAFSEVKGAIDQFEGKLRGWLGFFDAAIVEPKPFENFEELSLIKAYGGGGTSFKVIFDYVTKFMSEKPPKSIIILTDGLAPFPQESCTNGIPVLWLLNNNQVNPPWGKIARITV